MNMLRHKSKGDSMISRRLISTIGRRLGQGGPVRRTLPQNGRLHIDRILPFLVVYRRPVKRGDGTDSLVRGERHTWSPRALQGSG